MFRINKNSLKLGKIMLKLINRTTLNFYNIENNKFN